MKEPLGIESSDYEEKIRRNLLLASAISFCFTYLKLTPAKDTLFMGLKFENLTSETIYLLLLVFVGYELVQYTWLVMNKFLYWRVRLTGTSTQVLRGNRGGSFATENDPSDYTGKPENSNFYTWVLENKRDTDHRSKAIEDAWVKVESYVFQSEALAPKDRNELLSKLNEIYSHTNLLNTSINNIRVSASMSRFDNWFNMLVRSQSIRWVLLDFLLPIVFGLIAIIFLIQKVFL
ncbi:hypothetical protein AB6D20_025985 [Vibrio splendidus]